ncbi:MAG: hypothetical protein HKN19_07640 [Halioglobus sp.]|nr:hypothetical protein [Halioglobus sp.]
MDEITNWIDGAFGGELDCDTDAQEAALERALASDGYQRFLRDQVNRQIIRDYLTNALVLGVITEGALPAFAADLATEEGRSVLSLYMLMSSVEEASDLPVGHGEVVSLQPLQPGGGDRPHIKLVPSS